MFWYSQSIGLGLPDKYKEEKHNYNKAKQRYISTAWMPLADMNNKFHLPWMLKDDVLSTLENHSHISLAHYWEGQHITNVKQGQHTSSSRAVYIVELFNKRQVTNNEPQNRTEKTDIPCVLVLLFIVWGLELPRVLEETDPDLDNIGFHIT